MQNFKNRIRNLHFRLRVLQNRVAIRNPEYGLSRINSATI
nr:MAG TPA: hypothetical protein [Caudoviricetes sp.]DAN06988.1 MAG TPA: hypothetical protein [Caudoviricetes sp.]